MWLAILYLIIGLILILWGANALTDGASSVAKRMGVSDLIIGMTVIGLGTSMPELSVSLLSALHDSPGMAIGNVVGSNLVNILLIIGITALIVPIEVKKSVANREIVLLIASSLLLLVMGNAVILDGAGENILTRIDGIILIFCLILYLIMIVSQARSGNTDNAEIKAEADAESAKTATLPIWKSILYIVGGLIALVWGADRFVSGAGTVAKALGMSDALIGLTIVAVGTSLPELATSVAAAIKGKGELAVGNVIGSNIFNIFLILGVTATTRQLPFGGISNIDLLTMLLASVLFWAFARFYKHETITRLEGTILVSLYIAYTTYLISQI